MALSWTCISEYQNAGFNIYRRAAMTAQWQRVNTALVAGRVTNADAKTYRFCDWVEPGLYETDGTVVADEPGLRVHGFQFTPDPGSARSGAAAAEAGE